MIYDYVFVGAGIANLYAAYKLKNDHPHITYKFIEQNAYVGGRIGTTMFHGVEVVRGAGVGRAKKDYLLKQLLHEVGLETPESTTESDYQASNIVDVAKDVKILQHEYTQRTLKTFSQYASDILGTQHYTLFKKMFAYTDYENSDVKDTLHNYGLEDNYGKLTIFKVFWRQLITRLVARLGKSHFILNSTVSSIRDNFVEHDTGIIQGHKIVVGTTVKSLRKLFDNKVYRDIRSQPFLRIYAKIDDLPLDKFTVVDTYLQKLVPINKKKGVYMIAYADNNNALILKRHIADTRYFERLIMKSLRLDRIYPILDMTAIFWEEGTHYYKPLTNAYKNRTEFIRTAQHPCKNVWVVGEAVSLHQGWTEGALESVEKVYKELLPR